MAISPLIAKISLAVLGAGAVSAGVAVPLSVGQSANPTSLSSPEAPSHIAPPSPKEPTNSPLRPLDKETFETLTSKNELESKDCYTFFTDVKSEEVDLTSLLLFCSKADTIDGGEETYYFWDGKNLKKAVNLHNQQDSGDISVTLEGYSEHKDIFVEYDDQKVDDWDTIILSDCSIKSETRIAGDGERVLFCSYEKKNEEGKEEGERDTASENVFRLAKFDFSNKKK